MPCAAAEAYEASGALSPPAPASVLDVSWVALKQSASGQGPRQFALEQLATATKHVRRYWKALVYRHSEETTSRCSANCSAAPPSRSAAGCGGCAGLCRSGLPGQRPWDSALLCLAAPQQRAWLSLGLEGVSGRRASLPAFLKRFHCASGDRPRQVERGRSSAAPKGSGFAYPERVRPHLLEEGQRAHNGLGSAKASGLISLLAARRG